MRLGVAMRGRGPMSWHTDDAGQATVEAAISIPIVFTLLLLLIQPGIILYDRMVMRQAAAEGCRLLTTQSAASGLSSQRCALLVKRQLSAVPPHDLFHIHEPSCTWEIELSGDEGSSLVSVTISNRVRLLPLFDVAGAIVGVADSEGCLSITVTETAQTQPAWVQESAAGLNPGAWVRLREED